MRYRISESLKLPFGRVAKPSPTPSTTLIEANVVETTGKRVTFASGKGNQRGGA
jgi:hypothetical protein